MSGVTLQVTETISKRLGSVLIVGGGRMGTAICAGLLNIEGMTPARITVANPGEAKRVALSSEYGVNTVADATAALPADTVILAVKPGVVCEVARSLSEAGLRDALVVSVAAGVSTDKIAAALEGNAQVVRVMPNTPLLCGFGMSAISGGADATPETCELVRELFATMGHAVIVDEDKQDIVTAISGSGPAYFELVVETMARSGEKLGLDYDTSLELALQTMYGTAALIDKTRQDLPAAIEAVSSPGGTTVAALDAMRSAGLAEALDKGVAAAAARSKELGA